MAKKSINHKPSPKKSRITEKATIIKNSSQLDNNFPVFSFIHVCDNHCQLSDWSGQELIELIRTFKIMEQVPWNEITRHSGLRFKKIDGYTKPLPPKVSQDINLYEVRVCEVKRLFGYRIDDVFRVLWFDRKHEVCPENKQKRA